MHPVIKGVALAPHFLTGLMALAGDHNEVPVMRLAHGAGNRCSAVGFDLPARSGRQVRNHLGQYVLRVFSARVVTGKDHAIRALYGCCTHERSLARVPVAAAAHHAPELSAACSRQGA